MPKNASAARVPPKTALHKLPAVSKPLTNGEGARYTLPENSNPPLSLWPRFFALRASVGPSEVRTPIPGYACDKWLSRPTDLDHVKVRHVVCPRPDECHVTTIDLCPAIVNLTQVSQPVEIRLVGNSYFANFHRRSFTPTFHLFFTFSNRSAQMYLPRSINHTRCSLINTIRLARR